jgi:hypothetical protein
MAPRIVYTQVNGKVGAIRELPLQALCKGDGFGYEGGDIFFDHLKD